MLHIDIEVTGTILESWRSNIDLFQSWCRSLSVWRDVYIPFTVNMAVMFEGVDDWETPDDTKEKTRSLSICGTYKYCMLEQ